MRTPDPTKADQPARTSDVGTTWSRSHTFAARELCAPRTAEELQETIASSSRIRALGSRHSFNDVADTEGKLVTVHDLPERVDVDDSAATVTVSGGTTYGRLAEHLSHTHWALQNMGSLPHISVAGATATGTHGSGDAHRNLSAAVSAVDVVTADGEMHRWTREGHTDFGGRVLSLGALGVATTVTLDLVPTFDMRQDVWFDLPWPSLIENLDAIMASAYSVSVMPDWSHSETAGKVWLKSRCDAWDATLDPARFGARWARTERGELAEGQNANQTTQGGVPGPWWSRLPHFRPDADPSRGDEIQTEYFVPRRFGPDALRSLREVSPAFAPLVQVSELRTVAGDEQWLSPAHGRDSLAIHMTWRNEPEQVREVLPIVEAALEPYDPRPHWGKWFTHDGATVQRQYPRLGDFRTLVESLDPEGKFNNAFLERTLGSRRW
ncbi:D-arabinono-1,4-lactone oxidase [Nesterenkonia halobia]|uniref:FAD-binding protein n=1 Tax=Nesterenkonia halobia TaxID=37922 RepID=A0ABP6RDY9_9MICC